MCLCLYSSSADNVPFKTNIHTYVCVNIHTYVCVNIHAYVCVNIHTYVYVNIHTYVCVNIHTYVCVYVCIVVLQIMSRLKQIDMCLLFKTN
jgi:hypothetical protein